LSGRSEDEEQLGAGPTTRRRTQTRHSASTVSAGSRCVAAWLGRIAFGSAGLSVCARERIASGWRETGRPRPQWLPV